MPRGGTKAVRVSQRAEYWAERAAWATGKRKNKKFSPGSHHDSVLEMRLTLLPRRRTPLMGRGGDDCLRLPPPRCDWWASFCQLMEKPPLITIGLQFVTVSVPGCHGFILIRTPFALTFGAACWICRGTFWTCAAVTCGAALVLPQAFSLHHSFIHRKDEPDTEEDLVLTGESSPQRWQHISHSVSNLEVIYTLYLHNEVANCFKACKCGQCIRLVAYSSTYMSRQWLHGPEPSTCWSWEVLWGRKHSRRPMAKWSPLVHSWTRPIPHAPSAGKKKNNIKICEDMFGH